MRHVLVLARAEGIIGKPYSSPEHCRRLSRNDGMAVVSMNQ
jgi:hypothetical protein